ncbi:uncharacterized protein LOC111379498 [Olea europaea var. sylvestris]|uniref:uncharacterized protein LOC111379498 n=1 Tax=Olea europaea var. sylvestris TaxID=158386 RepID=UPI000C1D417A|nr:uncharacterized protein LOC111379498 [Olea europaea var. sylvestris]
MCPRAQEPDLPFWPDWGIPDAEKFCEGQVYPDVLEEHRRMLVGLSPLFSTMKEIGEEVLDLADIRGVEGMSFDPRALRNFVSTRGGAPPQGQPSRKKSKKRPRGGPEGARGLGETSRGHPEVSTPLQPNLRSPTPRVVTPRPPSEVVDLEDEPSLTGDFGTCHLAPELVNKYKEEVKLEDGMKVLEGLTVKMLSIARGLSLQGLEEAKRAAGVETSMASKDSRIQDLEAQVEVLLKERDDARREAAKARDDLVAAKDEVEGARLELIQKTKDFGRELEAVRERAWEEFKTSEDCDKIKGEYASGAYFHALKEARAFLRQKLPDVTPNDLKTVPSIADTLELSGSEDGGGSGGDDEEGLEDDVEIDISNLDPPLGHIG